MWSQIYRLLYTCPFKWNLFKPKIYSVPKVIPELQQNYFFMQSVNKQSTFGNASSSIVFNH